MLLGKVSQAMKFVNNEDSTRGVHTLTDEIKELLQDKHPKSREANNDILIPPSAEEPEPVIFEGIDGVAVYIKLRNRSRDRVGLHSSMRTDGNISSAPNHMEKHQANSVKQ